MTTTLDLKEVNRKGFNLDESGQLMFDGCPLDHLAYHYGTPCYIYSENVIRRQCRDYIKAFKECDIDYEVLYAGKAFLVQAMCQMIKEEGLSLDASSGGEIYTALAAGFPAERIYFHGNNKSEQELRFAISHDIGTIIIDNLYELQLVDEIANKLNKKVNIMIRIIPGVDTHTNEKIKTGQVDSKFGIPIQDLLEVFPQIVEKDHLIYQGIHCHIGSQLFDIQFYYLAIQEMVGMIRDIETKYKSKTNMINLGGGLAAKYTCLDHSPSINIYVQQLVTKIKEVCRDSNLALPKILVEPGRSIVAEAGITLYRIGAIKEITGLKKYLIVDGGMADNPRPSLYDAQYDAILVNKFNQEAVEEVTIAGKYCESGDILIQNIQLPEAENGDLILFFSTGAYHYAMSSNYNGIPRPPVVLVNQGRHGLMVKGETYEYLNKNHVFPEWFNRD